MLLATIFFYAVYLIGMKEKHFERTLVIIKPDAVQRVLVGEIIQRFERVGLKMVAMKMMQADVVTVEKHYSLDPDWKRKAGEKQLRNETEDAGTVNENDAVAAGEVILGHLKRFMTAGPIVPLVLEGAYAVSLTRKLVGGTEPFHPMLALFVVILCLTRMCWRMMQVVLFATRYMRPQVLRKLKKRSRCGFVRKRYLHMKRHMSAYCMM